MVTKLLFILTCILSSISFGQTYSKEIVKTKLDGNLFCPAFHAGNIVICSDSRSRIFPTITDKRNNEPVDLYQLNTSTLEIEKFDDIFRTNFNDGPVCFDEKTQVAVISQNQNKEVPKRLSHLATNNLGLFTYYKWGSKWSSPESFPYNKPEYTCTHPSLSKDGKTLYFASNMPGGKGGFDIYKSELVDSKWQKPVNLGEFVNSSSDEVFPSVSDSKLSFSSNQKGIGGLDLYLYDLGSTKNAQLLDTSINSLNDEFSLISTDNFNSGYFSSNTTGKDQLYKFRVNAPEFGPCDTLIPTFFCYELTEEYAMDIGSNEGLVYMWNVNGEKIPGITIDYCFPEPGDYEISLDIIDTIVNQTFYEQSYYYLSIQYPEQPYITSVDTVKIETEFKFDALQSNLPNLLIEDSDYYWSIGNSSNYRGISAKHVFTEPGLYDIQLGIIGYDNEVSQSHCVYKTIVVTNKAGFVPSNPKIEKLNLKENTDETKLIDEKHYYADPKDSLNTFYGVEFASEKEELAADDFRLKLVETFGEYSLKYIEEEKLYVYYYGQFETPMEAYEFWIKMQEIGLESSVVRSFIEENLNIKLDDVFILNNVKFDKGKWEVLPEALPELNRVIEIMKADESILLEISAYTDNDNTFEYNMKLSNKRAKSVAKYISNAGINIDRITTLGFGEGNPIASNDTEQGKALNRRVEFKLIHP